jgi:hypothetical protein
MASDETPKPVSVKKRELFQQSDFPNFSISEGIIIAKTLSEQYGGTATAPHDVAFALKTTPGSNKWKYLVGASNAYGLTKGAYNSKQLELSPLGRKYVSPTEPGDDKRALREAIMKPKIMGSFYSKYNHNNFPDTVIAENVLQGMGLPKNRASKAVKILIENGLTTGILRELPSGSYYVALEEPSTPAKHEKPEEKPGLHEEKIGEDRETPPRISDKLTFGKGLYVNFEIHIAADTPIETIIAIFQNMKKYLIDNE